jgi:vacuolar protein sorting-associated protein 13A/C
MVMSSQSSKTDEIHVGLSWTEGIGKYKLTKVITLAPRFIVKNNLDQPIYFREHGMALGDDQSTIDPHTQRPLHFMRNREEKLLTIAYPGLNAQWCDEACFSAVSLR